ncbi:MAG: hypothetical protein HKN13_13755, partial [Rhodothermales bacterium]|nr:hypothetical protein [Rhodothermales bacterium]
MISDRTAEISPWQFVISVSICLLWVVMPAQGQTNGVDYLSKGDSLYADFKNVEALE